LKHKARQFYQAQYQAYWEIAYQAYLKNEDLQRELLEEYEIVSWRETQNRPGIPASALVAYDFYFTNIEARDIGSVRTYRVPIAEQDTFAVRVTTDGDDGWLEVFDQHGSTLGAARTYIELIGWASTDEVREQVAIREFPASLANRHEMTLWGKSEQSGNTFQPNPIYSSTPNSIPNSIPNAVNHSIKLNKILDAAYHGKSLQEIAAAPVHALAGVSVNDAELLRNAFNVRSVRDLANLKYVKWAQAIALLADATEL
jgi:hypothetical protein